MSSCPTTATSPLALEPESTADVLGQASGNVTAPPFEVVRAEEPALESGDAMVELLVEIEFVDAPPIEDTEADWKTLKAQFRARAEERQLLTPVKDGLTLKELRRELRLQRKLRGAKTNATKLIYEIL